MLQSDAVVSGERMQIVLVEDDPAVRRSLQLVLHGKGYEVRSFASGVALLADPKARQAACLVTDYRLPEMDGFEILAALRKEGWQAPSVLVTAYHSDELAARARQVGFSEVIEKPLHERALADVVMRLLS